jgi:mannose-6-phosphate isomerase-like protein (cupin superfamily)
MDQSQIIEDPVLRQRLSFTRTTDEDGSEVLHVETWIDPGGGVTPHIHPAMEERFEVLSGTVSFLSGRKWVSAGPGETVVVPAGTRHAYRNKSGAEAHLVCHVRPPSTLQEFLEDTVRLSRSGGLTSNALPKSLHALLEGIVMAHAYRDMVTLLFPPFPPPAIQRLLIPPLARLGARRGIRAGHIGS